MLRSIECRRQTLNMQSVTFTIMSNYTVVTSLMPISGDTVRSIMHDDCSTENN